MKTEGLEITPINEFIIDVPEIDGATAQNTQLQIVNEGWGPARNPKLELRFARPMSRDDYVVLGEKKLTVADIDEGVKINIGPYLPPVSQWQTPTHMSAKNAAKNRYLELLGRLESRGRCRCATNRNLQSYGFRDRQWRRGLVSKRGFQYIALPTEKDAYPLFTPLANCISPKSADELVVRLTTKRSTRYKLKFTLTSTAGVTVENSAIVDILVPRFVSHVNLSGGSIFQIV